LYKLKTPVRFDDKVFKGLAIGPSSSVSLHEGGNIVEKARL
jgi:hypothetical protein